MTEYYRTLPGKYSNKERESKYMDGIDAAMLRFLDDNPGISPYLIKAKLHETIADQFDPAIFKHSPFYFEMGMKPAKSWGSPGSVDVAGAWMQRHFFYKYLQDKKFTDEIELRFGNNLDTSGYSGIDMDHCYCNYTRLVEKGLDAIFAEAETELEKCVPGEEKDFLEAACNSLKTVIKIADRFAEKAKLLLEYELEPEPRKFLKMIAETAGKVPRRPPETFYEGLSALIFFREVLGTIEGIGISVIGHPDRMLIGLYRNDLASGRTTPEEAEDIVGRWMLPTDCKFDIENNNWPETSTALMLGGCDVDGNPVYNELTRMFIECHRKLKLVNPKLNCRYSSNSPDEYLKLISQKILEGHNVFTLISDNVLIPAQMKFGKTLAECRNYGAGGCQETMVEGVENPSSPYYINMVQPLIFALNPSAGSLVLEQKAGADHRKVMDASGFPAFYREFIGYLNKLIGRGTRMRIETNWKHWPETNPCPFFSSVQYDCLKNHRDYSSRGGRYTPAGISLIGLGTLTDSLYAIKKVCFDEKLMAVEEFAQVLADNWKSHDLLRRKIINLPKFGHNLPEIDEIAAGICKNVAESAGKIVTQWNTSFEMSFFVYYTFVGIAKRTSATPDGRKDGEMFSQGISPGRLNPPEALTKVINSLAKIDFTDYPGNAVLDLQLPMGGNLTPEIMLLLIRTAEQAKIPTLQFNCVDVNTLKDAQSHPEGHRDLTVRISGLSAKFVALNKSVQDEIIGRYQYNLR